MVDHQEHHLSQAKELFKDSEVNITTQGRPYLGATLGPVKFCEQFVIRKVTEWNEELLQLAHVATTQPHATFAAFIHRFIHKFTYLSHTAPYEDSLV